MLANQNPYNTEIPCLESIQELKEGEIVLPTLNLPF